MVFRLSLPFRALAHGLAQLLRRGNRVGACARQGRNELSHMSDYELKDLGISRSDIPALFEDPQAWRRGRRGS